MALDRDSDRHDGLLLGVVIGVSLSAIAGVAFGVIAWLVKKQQAADAVGPATTPMNGAWFAGHGLGYVPWAFPLPPLQQVPPQLPALPEIERNAIPAVATVVHRPTSMRSFTLRDTQTVRVATAQDDGMTEVIVRVVQPPGSFASFAIDPGSLFQDVGVSIGDTGIVPAGGVQRFRLSPKQPLYARGSVNGVIVSITQSDLDDRDPTFSAAGD